MPFRSAIAVPPRAAFTGTAVANHQAGLAEGPVMSESGDKRDASVGEETATERALNRWLSNAIHLSLTGLAVVVFAAAAVATVMTVWAEFPRLWQASDEYNALQRFIQSILLVAIAAELALLLLFHRTSAAVEVIIFVIARKLVSPDATSLDLLAGSAALAGLVAVRFYFLGNRRK
jgi:hypothetical protein